MKNILIYLYDGMLAPRGGKLGYNYYLKQQLEQMNISNIHYIHHKALFSEKANNKIKNLRNDKIKSILTILKSLFQKFRLLYGCNHNSVVDLNKYDIVHFHSTLDMYKVRNSLKDYKGTVVLTSHTPTIQSKEMYEMLTSWEKTHMKWFYKKLIKIDQFAFHRANYIIFPCPEAEEPYYNNWDEFANIKKGKERCFRYLLTGTKTCFAKLSREEVCKQYGIPYDAFIICYVGRHNEIKGYDKLKVLGDAILRSYPNVFFLIAGREEPLKGLPHKRWIEVGWTSDPHSLISASDVFILPNKETYFDLVMLEVLSLGKIVIASYTGGNKYFKKISAEGVLTYSSLNEAKMLINKVYNLSSEEKQEMEQSNKILFENQFSLNKFASNYVELINSL